MKYCLIYSKKHDGYGLFDDLKGNPQVDIFVREEKENSRIVNLVKKIHLSSTITRFINLPFKNIWFKKQDIHFESKEEYCVMLVDLALQSFSQNELNHLSKQENIRCVLLLVNSIDSDTMKELGIKSKIKNTKWDDVYSYDYQDVKKYGYKSIEYAYYSAYRSTEKEPTIINDAYFVASLKPSRQELIFSLYKKLFDNGVNAEFHLMKLWRERNKTFPFQDEIDYYTFVDKSISYQDVISGDECSNTIIEILQDKQCGPSLRYFEAVVLNKKLLTNNKNIVNFPFYDNRYMKVFNIIDEIDCNWVKKREPIDYGYRNEFSPLNLLDVVLK